MNYKKFELRYSQRNNLTTQILAIKFNNGIKVLHKLEYGLMIGGVQTTVWYLSDGSQYETFTYKPMPIVLIDPISLY